MGHKELVQYDICRLKNVAACQYQFMTRELLQQKEDDAREELGKLVKCFDDVTRTKYLRVVEELINIAASQAVYGLA